MLVKNFFVWKLHIPCRKSLSYISPHISKYRCLSQIIVPVVFISVSWSGQDLVTMSCVDIVCFSLFLLVFVGAWFSLLRQLFLTQILGKMTECLVQVGIYSASLLYRLNFICTNWPVPFSWSVNLYTLWKPLIGNVCFLLCVCGRTTMSSRWKEHMYCLQPQHNVMIICFMASYVLSNIFSNTVIFLFKLQVTATAQGTCRLMRNVRMQMEIMNQQHSAQCIWKCNCAENVHKPIIYLQS